MYVDPFVMGTISIVIVELLALVLIIFYYAFKHK